MISAARGKIDYLVEAFSSRDGGIPARCSSSRPAVELGIGNIIVETDALLVKQAITPTAYNLSLLGGLAQDIRKPTRKLPT